MLRLTIFYAITLFAASTALLCRCGVESGGKFQPCNGTTECNITATVGSCYYKENMTGTSRTRFGCDQSNDSCNNASNDYCCKTDLCNERRRPEETDVPLILDSMCLCYGNNKCSDGICFKAPEHDCYASLIFKGNKTQFKAGCAVKSCIELRKSRRVKVCCRFSYCNAMYPESTLQSLAKASRNNATLTMDQFNRTRATKKQVVTEEVSPTNHRLQIINITKTTTDYNPIFSSKSSPSSSAIMPSRLPLILSAVSTFFSLLFSFNMF